MALSVLSVAVMSCETFFRFSDLEIAATGGAGGAAGHGGAGGEGGGEAGSGGQPACTPADCPGGASECEPGACDADDQCAVGLAPLGTTCSDAGDPDAQVCDDGGSCVECNDDGDCNTGAGEACNAAAHVCVSASCVDGVLNSQETDVDCGGADCGATCDAGQFCNVGGDCISGFCDTNLGSGGNGQAGQCALCSDSVDCGNGEYCDDLQACQPEVADGVACGAGSVCSGCSGADMCVSGNCVDGVCCNTSCDVLCRSCLAAETPSPNGTCDDIDGGTDPAAECDDGAFCTGPESCDGGGSCQSLGDPCPGPDGDADCSETCDEAADSCTANDTPATSCDDGFVCTPTDTCDANGNCLGSGSVCGDGVVCGGDEICDDNNTDSCGSCSADCQTPQAGGDCPSGIGCLGNPDCVSDDCTAGVCQGCGLNSNGEACFAPSECQSCFCEDAGGEGYCCDQPCAVCFNCQPGSGVCVPVGLDQIDPPGCVGPNACDGSGNCI